ncbi:hypothetical protein ABK046_49980, partial [Streptomyces caeruleatus]
MKTAIVVIVALTFRGISTNDVFVTINWLFPDPKGTLVVVFALQYCNTTRFIDPLWEQLATWIIVSGLVCELRDN